MKGSAMSDVLPLEKLQRVLSREIVDLGKRYPPEAWSVTDTKQEGDTTTREVLNTATGRYYNVTETVKDGIDYFDARVSAKSISSDPLAGMELSFSHRIEFLVGNLADATETDSAKNRAADKVVDLIMAGEEVPEELVEQSGRALANRLSFAIDTEGYDGLEAKISATKYVEKRGYVSKYTDPFGSVLPGCSESDDESTWYFRDPDIKTAVDAAAHLISLGLQWSKELQDRVDPSVTADIESHIKGRQEAIVKRQDTIKRKAPRVVIPKGPSR